MFIACNYFMFSLLYSHNDYFTIYLLFYFWRFGLFIIIDNAAVNILPNYNVSSVWPGVMSVLFCAVFSVSGTMPGTGYMLNKYLKNE